MASPYDSLDPGAQSYMGMPSMTDFAMPPGVPPPAPQSLSGSSNYSAYVATVGNEYFSGPLESYQQQSSSVQTSFSFPDQNPNSGPPDVQSRCMLYDSYPPNYPSNPDVMSMSPNGSGYSMNNGHPAYSDLHSLQGGGEMIQGHPAIPPPPSTANRKAKKRSGGGSAPRSPSSLLNSDILSQSDNSPMVSKKRKKKRDSSEPQKPVSAYALFFRDTQASIKGSNPSASFGEISRIVASMWEGLDGERKEEYKKKTDNAKKEYLKQLAGYKASLISQNQKEEQERAQREQQEQRLAAAQAHHQQQLEQEQRLAQQQQEQRLAHQQQEQRLAHQQEQHLAHQQEQRLAQQQQEQRLAHQQQEQRLAHQQQEQRLAQQQQEQRLAHQQQMQQQHYMEQQHQAMMEMRRQQLHPSPYMENPPPSQQQQAPPQQQQAPPPPQFHHHQQEFSSCSSPQMQHHASSLPSHPQGYQMQSQQHHQYVPHSHQAPPPTPPSGQVPPYMSPPQSQVGQ